MFENLKLKDVIEYTKEERESLLYIYDNSVDTLRFKNDEMYWYDASYRFLASILMNVSNLTEYQKYISLKDFIIDMCNLENYFIFSLNVKDKNNKELKNYYNRIYEMCKLGGISDAALLFHGHAAFISKEILNS